MFYFFVFLGNTKFKNIKRYRGSVIMFVTSISFSYFFLGIALISLIICIYHKALVVKTSPDNKSRDKIIGNMKDPITWRKRNNIIGNISIFWCLLSLALFIYFKYFFTAGLISIYYVFIYIAVAAASMFLINMGKKKTAQ
jgi:hypothetical protein